MNRVALVTGGGGGIGSAIVKALAAGGITVLLQYRSDREGAQRAADLARAAGADAEIFCADLTKAEDVSALCQNIAEKYPAVDTLINNAGVAQFIQFQDIEEQDWDRMLDTNLKGAYMVTKALLPSMISNKNGCIINIASMWGQVGASCEVHYSASKGGLIAMTKALAKEVGPSGIRVNCVAPGAIRTKMISSLSDEDLQAIAEETPLGRLGLPEDVAKAVAFLASDDASFITGQVLGVNGGRVI